MQKVTSDTFYRFSISFVGALKLAVPQRIKYLEEQSNDMQEKK